VDGALSHSSSIPVGAKHITNDIAVGLRVSLQSAEKIKLNLLRYVQQKKDPFKKTQEINLSDLRLPENLGEVSLKQISDGIIAPRLEEMYKLIFEEVEKSSYASAVPSGLVITGGGALTIGMIETGKRVMGMPIRIGSPTDVSGLVDELLNPQYATTVGLLLYGQQNIMEETNWKNFNRILREVNFGNPVAKVKDFLKQFIP